MAVINWLVKDRIGKEKQDKWRAPDGKPSMARWVAYTGATCGVIALFGGLALAFIEVATGATTSQGKEIALAGLGVFTAGGLTKVGNAIAEALTKPKV